MALPNVGAKPRYIEEIRIGGGFGSAPDGGVDVDRTGRIATDGDVTVHGQLDAQGGIANTASGAPLALAGEVRFLGPYGPGTGGTDRSWTAWLPPETALKGPTSPPSGPNDTWNGDFKGNFRTLDFSHTVRQFAAWAVALPPDYDGSPLQATLYWTAASGSAGDQVAWRVRLGGFAHGDDPDTNLADVGGSLVGVLAQADRIHTVSSGTVAPAAAMADGLLLAHVDRQQDHSADDLAAAARLIGLRIRYADGA